MGAVSVIKKTVRLSLSKAGYMEGRLRQAQPDSPKDSVNKIN